MRIGKFLVHHSGLRFPPGPVFGSSDSDEAGRRIYTAIAGQPPAPGVTLSESALKERSRRSIIDLFRVVNGQAELYRSLRGASDLVWQVVANEVSLAIELSPAEVEMAVVAIAKGRRAFLSFGANASVGSTPNVPHLLVEVDKFVSLDDATKELAAADRHIDANTLQGLKIDIQAHVGMIVGLTNSLLDLNIATQRPWPPAYFPVSDMVVLATGSVVRSLGGIDAHNRGEPVVPGSVHSSSAPADYRTALCRLALMNYTPDKDWALFLSPVGFLSRELRQDWYETLGEQSKAFAPINRFLDYAYDALGSRGKTFAVGMLTHWLLKPGDVERVADRSATDAINIWTTHPTIRRFGTVLVFCRIENKIQVIWYDPSKYDKTIRMRYAQRATEIFAYREVVVDRIRTWASGKGLGLHSRYWGGLVDPQFEGDSVQQSLSFLSRVVSADRIGNVLPATDDTAGFNRLGFSITES
ncbi:hypothetical protein QBC34DRAFT_308792 [Podospora aff. communis PSN243]|uniref:Uncharacterized protein n=1 Tax=Podospora aff. communis PSN243 TaxID=3040156 RepID=A0AAV9G8T1_9PEZI|nr:hypothetical protein QBC34DRAFT_308792 [Podospora aff. communis PSN243]